MLTRNLNYTSIKDKARITICIRLEKHDDRKLIQRNETACRNLKIKQKRQVGKICQKMLTVVNVVLSERRKESKYLSCILFWVFSI